VERDLGPVGRQFHVTSKWPSCGFDHQKIGAAGRSDQRAAIAVVDFEQSQHFHAVREIFQVDDLRQSRDLTWIKEFQSGSPEITHWRKAQVRK